ncbi:SbcC/MukB-like Walker B domain-containing protein [Methylicorpusculum sp.]|uniref:SbcC/MukB-like Walker B domain-containing protein n=1 Tax=Methylicorpusculum sp. TaxID=2713644 RepID=UPI00271D6096|nr:SbcC/MukB-like Walker B domain-containing protein [Methylicorpusculum sp.]MDO8843390.1 AAA family ATPase [Methylicorpusculum sp.]
MKILTLHFKNINSLEGENRVDFQCAPLNEAGVFAITGPNGSGKSSILDVITLSLYGETFRFDRPAQHVMTRHTAESFASVEFSVDQKIYKATWMVEREQQDAGGRIMAPTMKLIRYDEEQEMLLAETQHSVCQQVTEITGMNFRNFTRSIMLAQGDFAAFLNALDNERMDILEKIISADIYTDYKNAIFNKAEQEQATLALLNEEISALDLLPAEKQEAYEYDLHDFKDQLGELTEQQAEFKKQQAWLQSLASSEHRLERLSVEKEKLNVQLGEQQQLLEQIEQNRAVSVYKDACTAIEEQQKAIESCRIAISAYDQEIKQLSDLLATASVDSGRLAEKQAISFEDQQAAIAEERSAIEQYRLEKQSEALQLDSLNLQLNEKQAVLVTVDNWLSEHAVDVNLIDNFPETGKLKNLRTQLSSLNDKYKSTAKLTANSARQLGKNKQAIDSTSRAIAKLKIKLQNYENQLEKIASGYDVTQLEELLADQRERIQDFGDLYKLSQEHARLTRSGFSLFGLFRIKEEQSSDELELELQRYQDDLQREENIRKALEAAVTNEALVAKMAFDREHLVDGKPCPLCGSVNHPYAHKPPVYGDSKKALADQRAKIQALLAGSERLSQQIKAVTKQNENSKVNRERVRQIRASWLTLCNRLNAASEDLNIDNSRAIRRLLKTEVTEFKNINALAANYRRQLKQIEQIKSLIAKRESFIEQMQQGIENLEMQRQNRPQEVVELEQTLDQLKADEQALTTKVLEQLALVGETMPAKGKEDLFFDRMNQRRQDYQSYALRQKNLHNEIADLTGKMSLCQAKITELAEKLERTSLRLKFEEAAGLHLALVEKQKLRAEKERSLNQLTEQVTDQINQLQNELAGTAYNTVAEVIALQHLLARRPEIEQRLNALSMELSQKEAELIRLQEQVDAERAYEMTGLTDDELLKELGGIAEKIDITGHEITHLEKLLGRQLQMMQKYEVLSAKQLAQEEIVKESLAEVKLLEQEQGSVFRRKVQNKMAEQLLTRANLMLEKISGRFYLRQMPSEQGLALEIEDTYQQNARRAPKTLSGGESFVVSLALALGLSELASNGRSVESLFLDEGFGSLDAETLYIVISTLEGLRTQGKMVGVISHVEAVHKRIKAQLQMVKKPNGMSVLQNVFEPEAV